MRNSVPRVGFVLEQTLGHITHAANLRALVTADRSIEAAFAPIEFEVSGWAARLPPYRNWTVRAGLRARRAIRQLRRGGSLDALFVHTQVPAVLSPDHLRRTPTVVSLDATPIQYDELGLHYGHDTGGERIERLKWRANRACFGRASRIVTWSAWAKAGLVDRYDVPAGKVVVIPPGVRYEQWGGDAGERAPDDAHTPLRVLFVGGDLERKGGLTLLDAARRLRQEGVGVEVDLVTRSEVPREAGVTVHRGLGPNSPELIALYRRAHVFCLPTLGDCLPMVLSEAGAAGLPLVSTDVGAISEIVHDERTGLLVPPGDPVALAGALSRLAEEPAWRSKLGEEARRVVRTHYDAAANARTLVELLASVAREGAAT